MKYLITGLGNPGEKYQNTRHNVGYRVAEALARKHDSGFSPNRLADATQIRFKGKILTVIKPTTFMNLSGKAVNYWMQAENIPIERILVITDDLALPFGALRLKGKGSDGGHNGLKDIQVTLNSPDYARLRFGVGNEFSKGKQVDYVLGEWSPEEEKMLPDRLAKAVDIVENFVTQGLEQTMNGFNNK